MKISVRTLKHDKYEFIVEENDTIDHLKGLIQEKLGHEKTWQNLIFSGNMLEGARSIASYKITEKDFLVLLVKKPREVQEPAPAKPVEPEAKAAEPKATPTPQPTQPTQPTQAASPAAQGEEYETMVRRVMELGFERTQVERALQATFLNLDRAVELLMMGVPLDQDVQGFDQEMDDEGEGEIEDANQLFAMLRNSPHFNTLRTLARTNPDALENVLNQLPPEVLSVISSNQEEFLRLLVEDDPAGGSGGAPVGPGAGAQQPVAPGQQRTFTLSPEDQAVINNLVDMGFDKNRVTEAYLLFERDADMTANYLLNHGWDDLPPQRFTGQ